MITGKYWNVPRIEYIDILKKELQAPAEKIESQQLQIL